MEALAISAANLDIIEKNLKSVADELSGVINNVNQVNEEVNSVENKVSDLNDEIKSLVKEIRETTTITNARQSIMFNENIIQKKYGYYDTVRRVTEALLEAIENSSIHKNTLEELKEEILLNNPNYWLANSLAALSYWLLDDKENTYKELNNALKKDQAKTSIFFSLVNLKLKRINPSLNWLKKYLTLEDPYNLDKNFIVILDLITSGIYGDEAKQLVLEKINLWFKRLASDNQLKEKQKVKWQEFLSTFKESDLAIPYIEKYSEDADLIKANLQTSAIYKNFYYYLENLMFNNNSNKSIEEILKNLIYDYESNEQVYQNDNLRNNLIIACNGDLQEADKLYKKQESATSKNQDLITLLSNIIINKDIFNLNVETQKVAISLLKDYIITNIKEEEKNIIDGPFYINVNNFVTKSSDGKNIDEVKNDLNAYVNNEFSEDDKDLIVLLIIINIIGIVGIFFTLNNRLLSTLIIIILLISNILLFYKLNKRSSLRNKAKNKLYNNYLEIIEKVLAQMLDYHNTLTESKKNYDKLITSLNNFTPEDYITSNNERNIRIGD